MRRFKTGEIQSTFNGIQTRKENQITERELDHGNMRPTPSPISPVFATSEKQFCRRVNIDQCIAYLNQVSIFARFLSSTSLHVCRDQHMSTLASNDCSHCKLASFVNDFKQFSCQLVNFRLTFAGPCLYCSVNIIFTIL